MASEDLEPLLSGGGKGKDYLSDYHSGHNKEEENGEKVEQVFHFVSWPVGLAFDINYILGVGVLNIPVAFYNSGAALGVLFLLFVTLISGITVNWLLEVQARARTVVRYAATLNISSSSFGTHFSSSSSSSSASSSTSSTHQQQQHQYFHAGAGSFEENEELLSGFEVDNESDGVAASTELILTQFRQQSVRLLACVGNKNQSNLDHESLPHEPQQHSPLQINRGTNLDLDPSSSFSVSGIHLLDNDESVDPRDQPFYAGHIFQITTRKFENNQLCSIFLGPYGKLGYQVVLFLFAWGGMWSYAAVFATSTASFIPIVGLTQAGQCNFDASKVPSECNDAFYIFMAIFFCLVVPISLMDMTEQWIIQCILTCYRFLALFIMIVTVYIAMFSQPYKSFSVTEKPPYVATERAFHWAGFGSIFSVAVFAQMMHHSVPGLAQHVDHKTKLRTMFFTGFSITFTFYSVLGLLTSFYFGAGTNPLVTLNWINYTGLGFDGSSHYPVFARIISYIVIMFPVFDILSAFPLNAVTLGNNLYFGLPLHWTQNGTSRTVRWICRLTAAIPPIILATAFHNLSTIISFTGTLGFFLAFIFPGLLQIASSQMCQHLFRGHWKTPFHFHFSHLNYAYAIVVLACIGFVGMIVDISLSMS